jgi:hypothetical protein
VAAVNGGKHHSGPGEVAERYGRHSRANANGLSVGALLERVARACLAIRLAWRGTEGEGLAQTLDDFPTAVFPVIREADSHDANADEDTEPTTATRQARSWLQSAQFEGWPQALAG